MAGLLNPANQRPAPAGQPMPEEQQMGGDESSVSPEEQQQYDQFVTNGMEMMYSEEIMPQIIEGLAGDGNPIEGLGNTVAMIVMRLEDSAKESGTDLSGDVMYHGAVELTEQLAELGEEAGVAQYSQEDIEGALFIALDLYRATRQEQGTLPVDEISQDMNELVQADEAGTIEQMLPGVTAYAQRQKGGKPPQRGA